jgi:hypothetical protein
MLSRQESSSAGANVSTDRKNSLGRSASCRDNKIFHSDGIQKTKLIETKSCRCFKIGSQKDINTCNAVLIQYYLNMAMYSL